MKKIQFCINKMWDIYVDDNLDLTEPSEVNNAIAESIARENSTPEILFWESLEIVCSECGCSLNLDEEKKDGRCSQCDALIDVKVIG